MKKLFVVLTVFTAVICNAFSNESATAAFVEGCKAYSQGEWAAAKFMLKKAVSYKENENPDVYYMLIASEISDGDYKPALDDCNYYLRSFPSSLYCQRIYYLKGKVLYSLGEYEKSIITLSDFCHQNENDDLYSYALFYIGESLFANYQYEEAEAIYERIVTEYPESPKTPAAQYRIETILQRAREEKLLYLLKQTGEEYLSAKEEYEKQLRLYNSESINTTRQKLNESQLKNEELEKRVSELEMQLAESKKQREVLEEEKENILNNQIDRAEMSVPVEKSAIPEEETDVPAEEPFDETKYKLQQLKIKAIEAQKLIEADRKK